MTSEFFMTKTLIVVVFVKIKTKNLSFAKHKIKIREIRIILNELLYMLFLMPMPFFLIFLMSIAFFSNPLNYYFCDLGAEASR